MLEHVPAFLGRALKSVRAGHGKLAVARLADDRTLGAGGFALTSGAFENGEPLDPMFTADEEDACAPRPLRARLQASGAARGVHPAAASHARR